MISGLERNPMTSLLVSSSVQSAETEGTTDKTGKFGKRSRSRRSVSDGPTRMESWRQRFCR